MMETVRITIDTTNAAFDEGPATEVARILRKLADAFERDGIPPSVLYDINGNRVGSVIIEED